MRIFIFLLIGGACVLMSNSCSTCSRQHKIENITIDLSDLAVDSGYINLAQKVFYALPTPIELSVLIKNSGIDYQADLLNDPANASRYLTSRKMALNFGVFVTDLTYSGLFDQSQKVLYYKEAILKLLDGMGLRSTIDVNVMRQLEENIEDRDAVLRIISDTYASCTASLNEDDRYFLTLSMLVGGWIEGMYIAVGAAGKNQESIEERVIQLVIDQKFTFEMLWQIMSDLENIPEVADLKNELTGLARWFEQIEIHQTPNEVSVTFDGITSIASSSVHNVTPEAFSIIKGQIQSLRKNITKI